jgi:hypothetical protein
VRKLLRIGPVLAAVLACALPVVAAGAAAIPGAGYSGTYAGGGTIQLTVSVDGTRVTSYRLTRTVGDTCEFYANGDAGEWPGAAIADDAFEYHLYDGIRLSGKFTGAQSATGTFRLYNHAAGSRPACDSGTISWTATTTAKPAPASAPPGDPSPGQSPAQVGATHAPGAALRAYRTTVSLRRAGRGTLAGRVVSQARECRGGRRVTLLRGFRRIGSTVTKRDGRYSFRRLKTASGHRVRVTVSDRNTKGGHCASATSAQVVA